jgi:hypothetical protein
MRQRFQKNDVALHNFNAKNDEYFVGKKYQAVEAVYKDLELTLKKVIEKGQQDDMDQYDEQHQDENHKEDDVENPEQKQRETNSKNTKKLGKSGPYHSAKKQTLVDELYLSLMKSWSCHNCKQKMQQA